MSFLFDIKEMPIVLESRSDQIESMNKNMDC